MTRPAPLVEIHRGPFRESIHAGHAVIVSSGGAVAEAWGDPDRLVLPRSSVKMIQALPLLESGAGAALTPEQLALACASHTGERRHVQRVRQWLSDIDLDESALKCGPQTSRDAALAEEMIRAGQPVTRAFNNCSGKHAGFLTLARYFGGSLDYVDPAHRVQTSVLAAFEELTGETSPGHGIDGCSAPNYAATLTGIARAMAAFAAAGRGGGVRHSAAARLRDAMLAHPEMVSGKAAAGARIMRAARGRAVVKSGAEGVYVAILPDLGLGLALKIDDGASRAAEIATAALLCRLGVLDPADPETAALLYPQIVNWDGLVTGFAQPSGGLAGQAKSSRV